MRTARLLSTFLLVTAALCVVSLSLGAQSETSRPSVVLTQYPNLTREVWPADFNEDGITDLIGEGHGGDPAAPALVLMIGRGDGTFAQPVTIATDVAAPAGVGDLNADGFIDVVTTTRVGFGNEILTGSRIFGGRGDGSFVGPAAAPGRIGAPTYVLDMDGDGHRDLVTLLGDSISIYPGNGDFTFGTPVGFSAGFMVEALTPGDFNGDGLPDLASTSKNLQPRVTVFLNQGALAFATTTIPLDEDGGGITARDLNADGRLDLAVGSGDWNFIRDEWSTGHVRIFLGVGDGTFSSPLVFPTNRGPIRVVAGDFNGDGLPDIATGNRSTVTRCESINVLWDSVSILLGRGDGTLEAAASFALANDDSGGGRYKRSHHRLNTSDLNADGRTDLIASPGAVLLLGAPTANRPPVADAGPDRVIPLQEGNRLNGTATDPDHDWLTFEWRDAFGRVLADVPYQECLRQRYSGTHTFTLTARDGRGGEGSDTAAWTFLDAGPVPIPSGYQATNIGETGAAGTEETRGEHIVIAGAGADIWGTSDAFRFVYTTRSGDFDVVTQVSGIGNIHPWAKGGVMIRESLSPAARHASLFATPTSENGVAFQRREFEGGPTSHTSGPAVAPPVWLRLVRAGDVITASTRVNESDPWSIVGSQTLAGLADSVLVGLAVTSHHTGTAVTASFRDFAIGGASSDGTQVPPASQIVDASGSAWTLGAGGETLRDGIHAAWGYAVSLLWTGGSLYARAFDDVWWRWDGTGWVVFGSTAPGGGGTASPEGTEVPPASQIIDATGGVWTLGPGSETLRNGVHMAWGYGKSLLWTGGTLYARAIDDVWWRWDGTSWIAVGLTRPGGGGTASPDGTETPPAPHVIDATGGVWTLGPGSETLRNGVHMAWGYGRALLWTGGTLYAEAIDHVWWQWTGTAWTVYGQTRPGAS